jgi:hypothetical protein
VTAAVLAAGVAVLLAAVLLPVFGAARRRRRAAALGRDRAEALLSRLDTALDVALDGTGGSGAGRREAERCRLLAGAALAGTPTTADTARAERWARAGLRALGATEPDGTG